MNPSPNIQIINNAFFSSDWLSSNAFTDDAKRVLRDSQARAVQRDMRGTIPVAMVLLALLRWKQRLGAAVLARCISDMTLLESEIDGLCVSKDMTSTYMDFGLIDLVANRAIAESREMNQNYVGTEHIVLATIREADPSLAALFEKYKLTQESFKAELDGIKAEE